MLIETQGQVKANGGDPRRFLYLGASFLALGLYAAYPLPVHAQQMPMTITVATGETVTIPIDPAPTLPDLANPNRGVILEDGAALIVEATGTVTNEPGADVVTVNASSATITNDGMIIADGASGISAAGDLGVVVNTGVITGEGEAGAAEGGGDAVEIGGDITDFTNEGMITGTGLFGDGVEVAGGKPPPPPTTPPAPTTPTGDITGFINRGTISGQDDGIDVNGDISGFVNEAGGVIRAESNIPPPTSNTTIMPAGLDDRDGVTAGSITGLTNAGQISGQSNGISVGTDGSISGLVNESGGIIGGDENDGVIAGTIDGLTNDGSIIGGDDGVNAQVSIGSLTNTGTITGSGGNGIETGALTGLTNSGDISGGRAGIIGRNNITGFINTGTITGTSRDGIHAGSGMPGSGVITNLTNDGSIIGGDDGVQASAVDGFTNNGLIMSTGEDTGRSDDGNDGLYVASIVSGGIVVVGSGTLSDFTNNGTIIGGDEGVLANVSITDFTNTGTITGSGGNGIETGALTGLTNSGRISGGRIGVSVRSDISDFTNEAQGSITASNRAAISAETIDDFTNDGMISGGAFGISASQITNFESSGTIKGATGIEISRVFFNGMTVINNEITISGLVESTAGMNGDAILFNRYDDQDPGFDPTFGDVPVTGTDILNVEPGAGFGGIIRFNGTDDMATPNTLNIAAETSTIIRCTTTGAVTANIPTGLPTLFSGGSAAQPCSSNGATPSTIITATALEPATIFARQDEILVDMTRSIINVVNLRGVNRSGGAPLAQGSLLSTSSPVAGALAGPTILTDEDGTAYWGEVFGGLRDQGGDGGLSGSQNRYGGLVIGADSNLARKNSRIGVFGGVSSGTLSVSQNEEIDSTAFFAGLYGVRELGDWDVSGSFMLGYSDFDSMRNQSSGIASGDYNGYFISPEITLARNFSLGQFQIIPSVQLRYAGLFLDGYNENLAGINAFSVGSRDIHIGETRWQLSSVLSGDEDGGLHTRVYGGLQGRINFSNSNVTARFADTNFSLDPGGEDVIGGIYGGLRFDYPANDWITVNFGVEGGIETDDSYTIESQLGLRIALN